MFTEPPINVLEGTTSNLAPVSVLANKFQVCGPLNNDYT